jgi:hypothetical protein
MDQVIRSYEVKKKALCGGSIGLSVNWYQHANCFPDFCEIQWRISLQQLSNKHEFRGNRLSLTLRVVVYEHLPEFLHFLTDWGKIPNTICLHNAI